MVLCSWSWLTFSSDGNILQHTQCLIHSRSFRPCSHISDSSRGRCDWLRLRQAQHCALRLADGTFLARCQAQHKRDVTQRRFISHPLIKKSFSSVGVHGRFASSSAVLWRLTVTVQFCCRLSLFGWRWKWLWRSSAHRSWPPLTPLSSDIILNRITHLMNSFRKSIKWKPWCGLRFLSRPILLIIKCRPRLAEVFRVGCIMKEKWNKDIIRSDSILTDAQCSQYRFGFFAVFNVLWDFTTQNKARNSPLKAALASGPLTRSSTGAAYTHETNDCFLY